MSATASQPRGLASDRNKVIVLCVLLVVLLLAAYNMFSGPSRPASPATPATSGSGQPTTGTGGPTAAAGETTPSTSLDTPLNLASIRPPDQPLAAAPRNPFTFAPFPPPPPVKPQPIKPPPPISLTGVSPSSAIAGSPKSVTVTVSGVRFPGDAQVIWNGRPLPTQRVSDSQLRITLAASDIANPGGATVEVKSASQPDRLYSDNQSFQIAASPTPSFKYIGRVGDSALLDFGGTGRDAQRLVRVGDVVGVPAQWKVLAITPGTVELLDTRNEIKKSITLVEKK